MSMNLYQLTINAYSTLLEKSKLAANRLAAGYISLSIENNEFALKELEEKSLVVSGALSEEASMIASIISLPEKSIVAVNSSFGKVPLCVFSKKEDLWSLVKVDYRSNAVILLGPIDSVNILDVVKDSLIGEHQVVNFQPFSVCLNNDELTFFNLLLIWLGNKSREVAVPLMAHNYRFNIASLFENDDFGILAFADDVLEGNSETISLISDPERIYRAIDGLMNKHILVKSPIAGYLQPDSVVFNCLAPQKGMFIISYSDIATKEGHKYYVFPESILELSVDRDSVTFTNVENLDFSLWK